MGASNISKGIKVYMWAGSVDGGWWVAFRGGWWDRQREVRGVVGSG